MEVKELSGSELQEVCERWQASGVSESELIQFLGFDDHPKVSCCAVFEEGTVLALFEKRDALRSFKNMSILLAPEIDIAEGDYTVVSRQLVKITSIVAEIFGHFIESPLEERGVIKIWNDRSDIHTILVNIAQYLGKEYGESYSVKLYRNWVEIQKKGE